MNKKTKDMKSFIKKLFNTTKKILRIQLTILVLALLPVVVFTLLTSKTNFIAGIQSFVVLTGSMQPAIQQGSLVFTVKQNTYIPGDVIAYKQGNVTVTHRIIERIKNGTVLSYRTQGDANNTPDQVTVSHTNVLGKAENAVPYIGNLILYLKTMQGFGLFIVLPIFIFIGFELWNIKKEIERSVEQRMLKRLQSPII